MNPEIESYLDAELASRNEAYRADCAFWANQAEHLGGPEFDAIRDHLAELSREGLRRVDSATFAATVELRALRKRRIHAWTSQDCDRVEVLVTQLRAAGALDTPAAGRR